MAPGRKGDGGAPGTGPRRSRRTATDPWAPAYTITAGVARDLMAMERIRAELMHARLPPTVEAELRRQARVRSTHHSTRIEGNRLTLEETARAVADGKASFHGRSRDVREVRNYWNALLRVEEWAEGGRAPDEPLIRRLHALVEKGPRAKATPYRTGQNAVRDGASGALVYLPPEAVDVPALMAGLVAWIGKAERDGVPVPLIAGLAHYQFVTIHPYYDGNGRTARLLATFLLHRGGYGLNGFLSVEEFHARDLEGYYEALVTHPHHNYYMGRATSDLTPWLAYFVDTLARTFRAVGAEAGRLSREARGARPDPFAALDRRARTVLALFEGRDRIATKDVARALGLSDRMARVLLAEWTEAGWLRILDPSRRARAYGLSATYRQWMGRLSAMDRGPADPSTAPGPAGGTPDL